MLLPVKRVHGLLREIQRRSLSREASRAPAGDRCEASTDVWSGPYAFDLCRTNLCSVVGRDEKYGRVLKAAMRLFVVQWQGSVVGVHSCFPDAQCVERTLKTRGCADVTILEVRLNCESENGAALLRSEA